MGDEDLRSPTSPHETHSVLQERGASVIDFRLNYLAVVFIPASDIQPKPDMIVTVVKAFQDKEFIPGTFHEMPSPAGPPQTRLRMSSSNNEWQLNFGSKRVQIAKNMLDQRGSNLGSVSDFCSDALDLYGRVFNIIKKKASRLAVVTTFLLKEMTLNELQKAYLNLFHTTRSYAETPPIEWNWRSANRQSLDLDGFTDKINISTTAERVKGEISAPSGLAPLDRIRIRLDLNTIPENTENRFSMGHLAAFLNQIPGLHDSRLNEITELISGQVQENSYCSHS